MKGIYFGIWIIVLFSLPLAKAASFDLGAAVNINPIYNLSLNIETINTNVLPGGNLTVFLELDKSGREGEISVNLSYNIFKNKNIISSGNIENINISDHSEKNITIQLPSDIKNGRYIIEIAASHPQAVGSSDEDIFFVRRNIRFSMFSFIFDLFNLAFYS